MNSDKSAQFATDLTDEEKLSCPQIKAPAAFLAGDTIIRAAAVSQVDRSKVLRSLRKD